MRRQLVRPFTLALAALLVMSGAALAAPPQAADGFEYQAASEQAFLGIGCEQSAGGTCDSVEYWLGATAGQSNVGNANTFTPVGYAAHANGEDVPFATFPANSTLASSYVLRTDEPITGQVTVNGWAGGGELAVDSTVSLELTARQLVGTKLKTVTLGSAEVNKTVVTPGTATPAARVYAFEMQLDPALDGVEVQNLQLVLSVRGISVLQNGFVNGSGGSWLDLPYYELVPAT